MLHKGWVLLKKHWLWLVGGIIGLYVIYKLIQNMGGSSASADSSAPGVYPVSGGNGYSGSISSGGGSGTGAVTPGTIATSSPSGVQTNAPAASVATPVNAGTGATPGSPLTDAQRGFNTPAAAAAINTANLTATSPYGDISGGQRYPGSGYVPVGSTATWNTPSGPQQMNQNGTGAAYPTGSGPTQAAPVVPNTGVSSPRLPPIGQLPGHSLSTRTSASLPPGAPEQVSGGGVGMSIPFNPDLGSTYTR